MVVDGGPAGAARRRRAGFERAPAPHGGGVVGFLVAREEKEELL
jgi:hypothetical protein